MPLLIDLYLRKGADRRLRGGHLWVYSNEVDTKRSSLGTFQSGDAVCVRASDGKVLGSAYMEPQALICARLYAPAEQRSLDRALFFPAVANRFSPAVRPCSINLSIAWSMVTAICCRGLIVDRFGDYLVVQLNNAGIEHHREPLLRALQRATATRGYPVAR